MKENPAPAMPPAKSPGIVTFIFKYGLLGWGLGSGAAYLALEWMRHPATFPATLSWAWWFFPVMGMAAGLVMWLLGRLFATRKP